jgi:hypothetical protein
LKQGKLEEAIRIFEDGRKQTPFYRQRMFFETSLAAVRVRARQFLDAVELVRSSNNPISQVLHMHSLAALGRSQAALSAYSAVNDNAPPR